MWSRFLILIHILNMWMWEHFNLCTLRIYNNWLALWINWISCIVLNTISTLDLIHDDEFYFTSASSSDNFWTERNLNSVLRFEISPLKSIDWYIIYISLIGSEVRVCPKRDAILTIYRLNLTCKWSLKFQINLKSR